MKVHRVKGQFGADMAVSAKLYKDKKFNWRTFDAIHLLINHRNYSKLNTIYIQLVKRKKK